MKKMSINLGIAAVCGALALGSWVSPVHAEEAAAEHQLKINVGGAEGAGGTIKGYAKFNGEQKKRPILRSFNATTDKACAAAHKDATPLSENFVWGDNNTLQNVLVYVSKGVDNSKTYKPLNAKPELDQVGCLYTPHVLGIVKDQDLLVKNSDNTLHNVHAKPTANKEFNAPTTAGASTNIKFVKPEHAIPVGCDVHPWMIAYVHVLDNPFFAVTQQDGSFEIKGLPAGEYELTFWHENDKFTPDHKTLTVKVEEGKTTEADVTYSPPAPKK